MQNKDVLQRDVIRREPRENSCPECGLPPVRQHNCYHKDSCCANGHSWHTCLVHRRIVNKKLPSHEMIGCTCETAVVTVP